MRIIFAGTPDIAAGILHTVIDSNFNIVACYTQPDRPKGRSKKPSFSPVKELALAYNIPVLQPKNFKQKETLMELASLKPDLILVMAYGIILPQALLDIPKFGCINIHASILPKLRGAAPINYSILENHTESGITYMQMDSQMDTGDILATHSIAIAPAEHSLSLHDKLLELGQKTITDFLQLFIDEKVPIAIKQNNSAATYAPKLSKEQGQIDWHSSAEHIDRKIRAFYPWPGSQTTFSGGKVKIITAKAVSLNTQAKPGTIINKDKNGVTVATASNGLKITTLQFAGGKQLTALELYNSHKLQINDYFE